ncbi:hypothetical protein ACFL09_04775, partial [Planctomycetota bacterium]
PDGRTEVGAFPLFRWQKRRHEATTTDKTGEPTGKTAVREGSLRIPSLLPLLHWKRSERVETPMGRSNPIATTKRERSWGLFPLCRYEWSSTEHADKLERKPSRRKGDFHLLGWLYDWQRRDGRERWDDQQYHEYVRSRILWRVMHYERLDGDRSLDAFPFITWDRKEDGSRHVSFFWRLFRNERGADGGRKLDVLFVPLVRREGGG